MKSHGIPDDDNDHLLKNPNTSLDTSFMTDESESFIEESIFLKVRNKLKQQHQVTNKSIEIANVKHLPTLFFIIQLLLLSLLLVNFIPQTYSTFKTSSLYKEKMRLKYIPEYFGEQTSTVKALISLSQFILLFLILCLTSLIKQRISVPEYNKDRWRNYVINFSTCISVSSMVMLTFYNKETLLLSKAIGFVDNIFFLIFVLASFTFCTLTYSLIAKMNYEGITRSPFCLKFKFGLLVIMSVQVFSYFSSVLMISYYNPIITEEKTLLSLTIVNFSLNSVLFLMCLMAYVFSMKYDLYFVFMNLQVRPDIEYFVNFEDSLNIKSTF